MSRGLPRSDIVTAVALAVVMVSSIPAVFATAGFAASTIPAADTTGADPGDNTTTDSIETNASALETADKALADQPGDARLVRAQLDLVRELQAIADDSSTTERDQALDMAEAVLEQRKGWAASENKPLEPSMTPQFEAQQTKLDGARRLLETNEELQDADGLTRAVELAKLGTKMQAAQAEDSLTMASTLPAVETPNHASPSAATADLMARYDATPTAEDTATMRALDDLPEPQRRALTDFLDAFLAFQRTASEGDASRIFAARNQLLDKTQALNDAFESVDSPGLATPQSSHAMTVGCGTSTIGDELGDSGSTFCVFGLDDTTSDTRYEENYAVLVDRGGDDVYKNNAGGTNLDDNCNGALDNDQSPTNNYVALNNTVDSDAAAALVDLGGSDDYTRRAGFGCGQRGGGHQGSGFLVDNKGSDKYGDDGNATGEAHQGTNGGAYAVLPDDHSCCTGGVATGFLLDAGANDQNEMNGKDKFRAGSFGTNGGGDLGGQFDAPQRAYGFLMNVGGLAKYNATSRGTNGGSISRGSGFLADLDTSTDDIYRAESSGTNGGGHFQGKGGFLLDAGGSDYYNATSLGTNGGAAEQSTGFLLDAGVNSARDRFVTGVPDNSTLEDDRIEFLETFETDPGSLKQGMMGVNGGAKENGVGTLIDVEGDSEYTAGDGQGANGGAYETGAGLLVDGGGSDTYTAGYDPTKGNEWGNAGSNAIPGVFYGKVQFPSAGTNGGGAVNGVAAIVDAGDDSKMDEFDARDGHYGGINGTNGGGWALGVGLVTNLNGAATYTARSDTTGDNTSDSTTPDSGPVTGANGGGSGAGQFKANSQRDEFQDFTGAQWTPATYGAGTLVDMDLGSSDSYTAESPKNSTDGVNGGAAGTAATGVLLDAGGSNDSYIDEHCTNNNYDDDTVLPKGIAGAQIDSSEAVVVPPEGCN